MMKKVDLLLVFWFVLIDLSVFVSPQACNNRSRTFRPNGPYDVNRRAVLSYLPSYVVANDGFNITSVGQDPNRAYGLGMCIPGTDTHACSDCINNSSRILLNSCLKEREGTDWNTYVGSLCLVRYSDHWFDGSLDEDLFVSEFNSTGNIKTHNLTGFEEIKWFALMDRLISKASSSHYAADTEELSPSSNIYGFVQCSEDLKSRNCTQCLRQNANAYGSVLRQTQGGFTARPSCFMRWELYPFFNVFDSSTSPRELPDDRVNITKKGGKNISTGEIVATVVVPIVVVTLLFALVFAVSRRRRGYRAFPAEYKFFHDGCLSVALRRRKTSGSAPLDDGEDDITTSGSYQFEFREIKAATNNFQTSNKLGHGGFGAVYKGIFLNGTEFAAKRLSKNSEQGEQEFKNEVRLVAKLQHRNLVKLLRFSVKGDEKILVYEYVPNKSLDYFLFDNLKRSPLDWTKRLNIIEGITRGILYLHQDSRLTIIHRDLKASNILLDVDMNPKIADFGMARNVRVNQNEANTRRVVGTFGYMPPEYVSNGQFSTKSDVYSFGVLILEIIGGRKNSSFHRIDGLVSNLVTYVWRLWNNESLLELVDPTMGENYDKDEVIRCIHIGLLCVQENPANRPSMSTIFQMLTNTLVSLPVPQPPGFFFRERSEQNPLTERLLPRPSTSMSFPCSVDDASITKVRPR